MKRREFTLSALALVAAPVAVVKGWFEGKPSIPIGDDGWPYVTLPDISKIRCHECDSRDTQQYTRTAMNIFAEVRVHSVDLCDPCAEKMGYLCRHRNYVVPVGGKSPCICGKRGCPRDRVTEMKLAVQGFRADLRRDTAERIMHEGVDA